MTEENRLELKEHQNLSVQLKIVSLQGNIVIEIFVHNFQRITFQLF